MAFTELEFTKDWNSPDDFSTYEDNEVQVRADMQLLYDEIKDYVNNTLIPTLSSTSSVSSGASNIGIETITDIPAKTDVQGALELLASTRATFKSTDTKYIRVNADLVVEVSADNITWLQTNGGGGGGSTPSTGVKLENEYTALGDETNVSLIGGTILTFNAAVDILSVYVDNVLLFEGDGYEIGTDGTSVDLTAALTTGQKVHFLVLRFITSTNLGTAVTLFQEHIAREDNPHAVTYTQVGALALSAKATTGEAEAGTDDTKYTTPKTVKESIVENTHKIGDVITSLSFDYPATDYLPCVGQEISTTTYPKTATLKKKAVFAESNIGSTCAYKQIALLEDGKGVAASDDTGTTTGVKYTTDFGHTWTSGTILGATTFNYIALVTGGKGIAGSANTSYGCFYTVDGGTNWTVSNRPTDGGSACFLLADGKGIMTPRTGNGIYYTTNYGQTWTISSQSTVAFTNVNVRLKMLSTGQCVATTGAGNGGIYCSSDYGVTWAQSNKTSGNFYNISIVSGGQGIAAGDDDNGIWYTEDYGATWTQSNKTSGKCTAYDGLTLLADGHGIASQTLTSGYYTTDYGKTWAAWVSPAGTASNGPVVLLADGRGLTSGTVSSTEKLWYTLDFGATWKLCGGSQFTASRIAMITDGRAISELNGSGLYYSDFKLIAPTISDGYIRVN